MLYVLGYQRDFIKIIVQGSIVIEAKSEKKLFVGIPTEPALTRDVGHSFQACDFTCCAGDGNFKDLVVHQLDIKTAFLNGELEDTIDMAQAADYKQGALVCRLKKSHQGLR